MGFSCDCDADGYTEFYNVTEPRARKQYRCEECRQTIEPGQIYHRIFSKFDGEVYTQKHCERCADLMSAFSDVGYCWETGNFLITYREWLVDEGKKLPDWLNELLSKEAA